MNIVSAIREPARAAGRRAGAAALAARPGRPRRSARCWSSPGVSGEDGDHARPRRLARDPRPRAARAPLGVPDRAVRTGAGLRWSPGSCCPISRWLFGELKTNFSIFVLGGLMIVIGATWAIMYNADLLLGALGASLGRIRRLAPVLQMSIAYPLREPLPHRRHAGDVHARRVHARRRRDHDRARSSAPSTTSTPSAAASTSARPPRAAAPDRRHAQPRSPARPALDAGRLPRRRQPVVAAGQGAPDSAPSSRRTTSSAASTPPSSRTRRYRLAAPRARLRLDLAGRLARARDPARLAVVDAVRRPAPRELGFVGAVTPDFQAPRLLPRGQDLRPGPGRRARPADRQAQRR